MFNLQMSEEIRLETKTDLWDVTAPRGFLLQGRGEQSDGNRRTTARIHRDAEVETIVLSSSSARRTWWRVCSRQQVACWSCRTVTYQTQTAVVGTRCKQTRRLCVAVNTMYRPTVHQNEVSAKHQTWSQWCVMNVLSSSKLDESEVASSTSEHSLSAILPQFCFTQTHKSPVIQWTMRVWFWLLIPK